MELPFFKISAKNFEGIKQPFESLLRCLVNDETLKLIENSDLSPTELDLDEENKDAVVDVIVKQKSSKKVPTEEEFEKDEQYFNDLTKDYTYFHEGSKLKTKSVRTKSKIKLLRCHSSDGSD